MEKITVIITKEFRELTAVKRLGEYDVTNTFYKAKTQHSTMNKKELLETITEML